LCTEDINITIATATSPTVSIVNSKDVSCFGLSDGSATALATGGNTPYTYSWNTTPVQNATTAKNLSAGNYSVTVTDNNGCFATTSVQIIEPPNGSCGEIYFPNTFTPNGDMKNDDFGPLGNITAISNYRLQVYNRYGELVFSTRDPFEKWNGLYRSKLNSPGSFVWLVTYTYKGRIKRSEQGSVTLLR